jgi:hypothetical protein
MPSFLTIVLTPRLRLIPAPSLVLGAMLFVACQDSPVAPAATRPGLTPPSLERGESRSDKPASDMTNYVAIGTSISMGWANDGVVGASQENSWSRQLASQVRVPAAVAVAVADPAVAKFVSGTPKKIIFVLGRLLNIVA